MGGEGGRGLEEWEEEHVRMGGESRVRRRSKLVQTWEKVQQCAREGEEQERWWMEKKEQYWEKELRK